MFLLLILLLVALTKSSSTWGQLGQDIDGEALNDRTGRSVSLSSDGNTVAIGAFYNDGNGTSAGHTRVYRFGGTTWSQLGQDIDGEASGDQSGTSVSLSTDGMTVAIGAPFNDGYGDRSGHARVYRFGGAVWSQLGQDIDGEAEGDRSGYSVTLSSDGGTVVIGATYNDGNGNIAGHVRVYRFDGATWSQLGQDIDGATEGDQSGYSVSLSSNGETVAIGAPYNDGYGANSGHVRVYRFGGTTWSQLGQDIDGEVEGDEFGWSVSLSSNGNTVAIGAPYNDGNGNSAGHTRVYRFGGTSWAQLGQDIDGEAEGDLNGRSVSLSSNGETVAIGAIYNGGNGNSAGHTRVYRFGETSWAQLGEDIDGEAEGDISGRSVSLSSNGMTVAIGAVGNDELKGHVRVYRFQSPTGAPVGTPVGTPTGAPTGAPTVNLKGETDSDNATVWIVVGAVITPTFLVMIVYYFLKIR